MVNRALISCNTCFEPLTLRIWVGHNSTQHHAFLCPNCKEEITVSMDVDYENISTDIHYLENCSEGDKEGVIINLNPHFVIDEDTIHSDKSFPWMEQSELIQDASGIKPPVPNSDQKGPLFVDTYELLGGISFSTDMWKIIKKGWSLSKNGQNELAIKNLEKYKKYGFNDEVSLERILFDFCGRLIFPRKSSLLENGIKVFEEARDKNVEELYRFKDYYTQNFKERHLERYYDVFSEYFRDYAEYDQTILFAKNNVEVPDGCMATSSGFKHTKMFYGNAFEAFTSNITVLALLNNICEGRPFDQFQKMDLKKYLTINKARRGSPFEKNELLTQFLTHLDSTLRNSSHHGAMRLIKHRKYIEYRSGGTGAKHTITYSKYLEKCSNIMLTCAALLMLELVLAS